MDCTNRQVAEILRLIAQLHEVRGGNPFRVRAFLAGAEAVERLPRRVNDLGIEELRALAGIGERLASVVQEICRTGSSGELAALQAEVPAGLLDLLRVEGVGPKTAGRLWRELGVTSVAELKEAAERGRIRRLKGFGPKREAELLRGAERFAGGEHRMTRAVAEQLLSGLAGVLSPGRYVVAGSYRRGSATVGDLDLVSCEPPEELNPRLRAFADEVIEEGERRTSIRYRGERVDLRYTTPEALGPMLLYLTGSKAFNIRLRDRALLEGLRVNEYGIAGRQGKTRLETFPDEASMFAALGLPFIPPELREDRGEIEAAEHGTLPDLVGSADLRGDLHVHSTWSDGALSLDELAAEGTRRGYEYLIVSDHSETLRVAGGLSGRDLAEQRHAIEMINRSSPCRLIAGVEVDLLADGSTGLPNRVLADLEVVIASVHSSLRQDADQMTRRLIAACENEHVDIIGHPTGRLIGRREPVAVDLVRLIESAAGTGTALEINASPFRLDLDDLSARAARDRGVRLSIGSDAHRPDELGHLGHGLATARRGWCTAEDILNTLPLDRLLEWVS
ncbi:MAG TPA: DNA polymerase/3'-5' exonuclease PolX [Methanoregulaceae archaeon]|nr:DNA polymerase/3'-5' exonuclease PolX [Methanoregulaceae archaeon]